MGYRWYKGVFVNTEEYKQIKQGEEKQENKSFGTVVLFIIFLGTYLYFSGIKDSDNMSKMDYIMFFVLGVAAYLLNKLGYFVFKITIGIFFLMLIVYFVLGF